MRQTYASCSWPSAISRVVNDREYRARARAEIAARCGVLYADDAEVRDLEDFFDDALAGRA